MPDNEMIMGLCLLRARRQLGLQLHVLGSALPLYDGASGAPVPPDVDARVERVRRARPHLVGVANSTWGPVQSPSAAACSAPVCAAKRSSGIV